MLREMIELSKLLYDYKRPLSQLRELQNRRLRVLIHHAYERVPYYRHLFDSAGIAPADIRTVEDLPRLPITTKQMLRATPIEQLVATGTNLTSCIVHTTGGTTGEPFHVYFSPADIRARRLVDFRALLTVGIRPWDRVAILGPRSARPSRPHERLGLFRTQIIPGSSEPATQIRLLRDYQPTVLWAYAHELDAIVYELQNKLSSVVRPRVLIISAYTLPNRTAQALHADLGATVFNFYGAMEVGRIAHECPAHRGLHVNSDRLILECVPDESSINGSGSAIVTALDFFTMPFIRYRLGDLVKFAERSCVCGSEFPLIETPSGREYELCILPSGKRISVNWLMLILRGLEGIDQYRVIQERPDYVVIQLSFFTTPRQEMLDHLEREISNGFPESVQIDIQLTDFAFARGRKFKAFVSNLQTDGR
jgi:phenylacetate-CoA ligase